MCTAAALGPTGPLCGRAHAGRVCGASVDVEQPAPAGRRPRGQPASQAAFLLSQHGADLPQRCAAAVTGRAGSCALSPWGPRSGWPVCWFCTILCVSVAVRLCGQAGACMLVLQMSLGEHAPVSTLPCCTSSQHPQVQCTVRQGGVAHSTNLPRPRPLTPVSPGDSEATGRQLCRTKGNQKKTQPTEIPPPGGYSRHQALHTCTNQTSETPARS